MPNIFLNYVNDLKTIGTLDCVTKKKDKYLKFINENKIANTIFEKESKKINTITNQHGGDPVFAITVGSVALIGLAYGIYKYLHRPKCKIEYPLVDETKIPTPLEILMRFLPKSFMDKFEGSDNILNDAYKEIREIAKAFDFLDEDTTGKKIVVETLKITASVGADIITFGAGGDVIISLFFTIKNILDVISKVLSGLVELLTNKDSIRLIYDILNVNFKSGPFGVKCWIKYILNEYGYDSPVYGLICKFFDEIMEKLASFIGNALGAMIPDSAGLPGLIIPILIDKLQAKAVRYVEKKIKKYYRKIPRRYKILIQNPKAFKQFLDKKLKNKKNKHKIYKYLGKDTGKHLLTTLKENTGMISYGIHKGFSLMFVMLEIFVQCEA